MLVSIYFINMLASTRKPSILESDSCKAPIIMSLRRWCFVNQMKYFDCSIEINGKHLYIMMYCRHARSLRWRRSTLSTSGNGIASDNFQTKSWREILCVLKRNFLIFHDSAFLQSNTLEMSLHSISAWLIQEEHDAYWASQRQCIESYNDCIIPLLAAIRLATFRIISHHQYAKGIK